MPWSSTNKCSTITLDWDDYLAKRAAASDFNVAVIGTQGRGSTGKYYFELQNKVVDGYVVLKGGISFDTTGNGNWCSSQDDTKNIFCRDDGYIYNKNSYVADLGQWYSDGRTLMVAVDFDNSKLWFGVEGTWYNSGNPATGANPTVTLSGTDTWYPFLQMYTSGGSATIESQVEAKLYDGYFKYTKPSGFSGWDDRPTSFNGGIALSLNAGALSQRVESGMTWNPLEKCSEFSLSNSDRTVTYSYIDENNPIIYGELGRAQGKYYFDMVVDSIESYTTLMFGVALESSSGDECSGFGSSENIIMIDSEGSITILGDYNYDYSGVDTWGTASQTVSIAIDFDAGKVWFGVDGSWLGGGDPSAGTLPTETFSPPGGVFFPFYALYYDIG